jgi:SRSO17 transposase
MKITRIPHAPSAPLPELAEFLAPFRVHFARSEGPVALERYLTGLLTEHPNKNCDTIAQVVPGTSEQRLQGLMTAMDWDEDNLNRQRVQRLLQLPTEGDAVLIFDDTGFAKQGRGSLGVARQYSGTLGKTVNCHSAERTLAWPVATRLDLPKDGADDTDRRTKAKVPEAISFQTQPEIARELRVPRSAWRTVRWRQGSDGWRRGRFAAVRSWRVLADGRRRLGWLIGARPGRGQTGKAK